MTRFELGGAEGPINTIAFPTSETDESGGLWVVLEDGKPFLKNDYLAQGYTNFDAYAIGAQGGKGGDASVSLTYTRETALQAVPQGVWDLWLEKKALDDYFAQETLYNAPAIVIPNDQSGLDPNGPWRKYSVAPVLNQSYKAWKYYVRTAGTQNWQSFPNDDNVDPTLLRYFELMREFGHEAEAFQFNNDWAFWQGTYVQLVEQHNPTHQLTFTTVVDVQLVNSGSARGGPGGGGGLHKVSGVLEELTDQVTVSFGTPGTDSPFGQGHNPGSWTPTLAEVDSIRFEHKPTTGSSANRNRLNELNNYFIDYLTSYPDPPSFTGAVKGGDGGTTEFGDICHASGGEGGNPGMSSDGSTFVRDGSGGDGGLGNSDIPGGGAAGSATRGADGTWGTWDGKVGQGGGGGHSATSSPSSSATRGGRGSYDSSDPSVFGERGDPATNVGGVGGGADPHPQAKPFGSSAGNGLPNGAVVVRLSTAIY